MIKATGYFHSETACVINGNRSDNTQWLLKYNKVLIWVMLGSGSYSGSGSGSVSGSFPSCGFGSSCGCGWCCGCGCDSDSSYCFAFDFC